MSKVWERIFEKGSPSEKTRLSLLVEEHYNISNLTLRVNKKLDKQTFINALYQDAPVYLDRKYDKYLMAIELLK